MSERSFAPDMGCGLDIGTWFMRSLLDSEIEREREREKGRGGERIESKTGSRQIRRPFHPDEQILRSVPAVGQKPC
jgi:hypothetical protein